jgi:hypothetical protein
MAECESCKGTGFLMAESVEMSRPYINNGKIAYDIKGLGDWQKVICYCRSDENDNIAA